MSNKITVKRNADPLKKVKQEEKKSGFQRNRRKLAGMIPAIVFIGVAIWYFLASRP